MKINNFNKKLFLKEYWQKKPLVIRHAFEDPFWLDANDLAGLSCEDEAESRIIVQDEKRWNVEHGPFEDKRFATLPKKDWTLLVQAVDQWFPEVKDILNAFDFLPRWRLDDVMVSYAPIGGTVSQHYDFFDVFLIQGEGCRNWQVGSVCGSHSELVPETSVRILKEFNAVMDVTLNPGDMLYIPAKHSHLGVSIENSLTYSVGFKAPSIRDIVDGVATSSLENLLDDVRYQDTEETLKACRGEISAAAIRQVRGLLAEAILDDNVILSWLGQYVTERKYPDADAVSEGMVAEGMVPEDWVECLKRDECLYKNPSSRFAYSKLKSCTLFVDGESYQTNVSLAELLSDFDEIDTIELLNLIENSENRNVIEQLLKQGLLYFEGDG